ncbi:MAG: SAM-dependent methyltransferase, partial [Candidatus Binatota bacterium]
MRIRRLFLLIGLAVSLVSGWNSLGIISNEARVAQAQESGLESKKIVPFVPTPQDVVERMLELAQVKKGDVVYDLGSGD